MTLETVRLVLRPWRESDAESLYEYAKDDRVGPIAGWPPHTSVENSWEIIKNVLSVSETYAVCLKEDDKAIGSIGLKMKGYTDMTDRDDECELGYWLGVPFWGKGLMPEAAEELIRHAFADLGMNTVWCGYYDGNARSKRVQEKCGFKFHHTCTDVPVPLLNETRTGHTNILTKEEWKRLFIAPGRRIVELRQWHDLKEKAAEWFSSKWSVPKEAYLESIEESFHASVPNWYLCLDGDKIIAGMGVIANDFHNRPDLTPNVCAVFTEPEYRNQGICGKLLHYVCEDMKLAGNDTLYLLTDHAGFYERYGWEYLCPVQGDGEETVSRMYIHRS